MLPEVAQRHVDQLRGGPAHDHLPTVRRCGDPGRAMDVGADVALVGQERSSGEHPDPKPDGTVDETLGDGLRCGEGIGRVAERQKEGVALGIDLGAPKRTAGVPNDLSMDPKRFRVLARAELVEQAGRTFDVREQEGHCPRREVVAHARCLRGFLAEFMPKSARHVRATRRPSTTRSHPLAPRCPCRPAPCWSTWVGHDLNHLSQIASALAYRYETAVGPWRSFLGILEREP